jgi:hypothetical protein
MDELDRWLDAYELEQAERDLRETPPKELYRAWYQKAFRSTETSSWYEFEDGNG